MKKMRRPFAAFTVLLFTVITAAVQAQDSRPVPSVFSIDSDPYRLSFATLMQSDEALIRRILENAGKSGSAANSEPADDYPFQAAVLNINLILLTDDLKTLDAGVGYLEKVPLPMRGSPLYRIYRGMAEAFLARRWTIFGLDHLKNTERYMISIPEDYPDWYIRLLRGVSYYSLGRGLPGIGPMQEPKDKAERLGEADLQYVIERFYADSTEGFDAGSYDWERMPVPDIAANFAHDVLYDR